MRRILSITALCLPALALPALPLSAGDLPEAPSDDSYIPTNPAMVALGQLLFYDPILSGNRNISCSTCHHPRHATADGVALSLGEGGIGLGPDRVPDPANLPEQRIPRNAPALFNLGAAEFVVLFHDGRLEADPNRPGGLRTPMGPDMVSGFDNALSAQTMFPVLSQDEMAGHVSENDVAKAVRRGLITGDGGAWDIIADRVAAIDAYQTGFKAAVPEIAEGRELAFTDISNAIAAFIAFEWRSDDSAFDRYLRGEASLTEAELAGLELFYGPAGCAGCHAGPFQTDHGFHAMGVPQFGPGKAARFETHVRDDGRLRVTGDPADAFAFRTPSLRNVTHTAPYGHSGAYADLRAFVAAHADPVRALQDFDRGSVDLAPLPGEDPWRHLDDPAAMANLVAAIERPRTPLNPDEIDVLVAFLGTLSDPVAIAGRLGVPETVPSGLAFER